MRVYPAPKCSLPGCRVKTADPTGRCHHHRAGITAAGSLSRIPPIPVTDPDVDPFPDGTPVPTYDPNGVLLAERYYRNGELHREDGPAVTTYLGDGRVVERGWYLDGNLHRLDGPALQEYTFANGALSLEQWHVAGKPHRLDGPADIEYYEDGSKNIEHYYRNGELHRVDGPATLFYANGRVYETFYLYGEERGGYDEIANALSWREPGKVEAEFRSSGLAPLLDEGVAAHEIAKAFLDGIHTVEGIRALHGGAPAEWVRSFESGSA